MIEDPAKTIKTEDVENIINTSVECTPGPDVPGAKRTDVLHNPALSHAKLPRLAQRTWVGKQLLLLLTAVLTRTPVQPSCSQEWGSPSNLLSTRPQADDSHEDQVPEPQKALP